MEDLTLVLEIDVAMASMPSGEKLHFITMIHTPL